MCRKNDIARSNKNIFTPVSLEELEEAKRRETFELGRSAAAAKVGWKV